MDADSIDSFSDCRTTSNCSSGTFSRTLLSVQNVTLWLPKLTYVLKRAPLKKGLRTSLIFLVFVAWGCFSQLLV